MKTLEPEEYDIRYFDPQLSNYKHNAGYSEYKRWYRNDGPDSQGEHFRDIAKSLFNKYQLLDKKVLEIGCAKGFVVKDLRDFGANAYGIDISQYAIDNCEPEVKDFLNVADARIHLANYKANEFDFVFSLRFFECLTDSELDALIPELNRVGRKQYHRFGSSEKTEFYINRDTDTLLTKSFRKGTEFNTTTRLDSNVTK